MEPIRIELPPFFLNQSRLKTSQDCPRLYAWQHVEGLSPLKPRKQLVVGTAVHQAQLEIHEIAKGGIPSVEVVAEATRKAVAFVERQMRPLVLLGGQENLADQAARAESVDTVNRVLPAYYRFWGELGQMWKPLGQELEFDVEVGEGTGVRLVGKIDNLALFTKGLWIIDYKTMAAMKMQEFLKYQLDVQLTAYIYGGNKQLALDAKQKGKAPIVISGAIIDGIIKTDPPNFHRELYSRTLDELRQFEMEFCFIAWELGAKHALHEGNRAAYNEYHERMWELGREAGWKVIFPKATNRCFQYGQCTHRDLCVQDNATRRLNFTQRSTDYVDAKRTASTLAWEREELNGEED